MLPRDSLKGRNCLHEWLLRGWLSRLARRILRGHDRQYDAFFPRSSERIAPLPVFCEITLYPTLVINRVIKVERDEGLLRRPCWLQKHLATSLQVGVGILAAAAAIARLYSPPSSHPRLIGASDDRFLLDQLVVILCAALARRGGPALSLLVQHRAGGLYLAGLGMYCKASRSRSTFRLWRAHQRNGGIPVATRMEREENGNLPPVWCSRFQPPAETRTHAPPSTAARGRGKETEPRSADYCAARFCFPAVRRWHYPAGAHAIYSHDSTYLAPTLQRPARASRDVNGYLCGAGGS